MMYGGWIGGILLIIILIFLLRSSSLFKASRNKNVKSDSSDTALETLKNRYAKGEISESEFEEKKAKLQ